MQLTDLQKRICIQVINVFETGSIKGKYDAVVVYADGPGGIRQITYGRSCCTQYGTLPYLLKMYCARADAIYGYLLEKYIDKVGLVPSVLVDDANFKQLLASAGALDPVMQECQDQLFSHYYFEPAMKWCDTNGFVLPLSALVIYDSFIHSGGILSVIRKMFPAVPPVQGGDEQQWTTQYCNARKSWLLGKGGILAKTIYRQNCFLDQIVNGNWDLDNPVNAHGVVVTGE